MIFIRTFICSCIFFFTLMHPVMAETPIVSNVPHKNLAIVIDDLGNNMKGTEEILNLPIHLTVAIMPFMSTTKIDAELAHINGHEVIVHLPMEPKRGKKSWLGPGAITTDLSDEEVRKRVKKAIEDVPHAVGMNNHMGSKVTEDERIMRIVLEVCKEYGFFFLDSKTTGKSVIPKLAEEMNVPLLENNLFFDEVYTTNHIKKQAELLAKSLNNNDQLIAIGHVGVTGAMMRNVLYEYIPVYRNMANIVSLSGLIPEYKWIDEGQ